MSDLSAVLGSSTFVFAFSTGAGASPSSGRIRGVTWRWDGGVELLKAGVAFALPGTAGEPGWESFVLLSMEVISIDMFETIANLG